jgi:hypothetical protein
MYLNYTNPRLLDNHAYQQRTVRSLDSVYQHPQFSLHRRLLNTNVDGVQVGGYMNPPNNELYNQYDKLAVGFAAYKALKSAATSQYGQKARQKIRNTLGEWQNSSNPNWRPTYPGETHMVTSTGVSYNYAGPGTNLQKRLARGDPPLDGPTGIDQCAKTHDIAYNDARTISDVRDSDKVFNRCVANSSANVVSKGLVRNLMRAKMFAEDVNLLQVDSLTDLPNLNTAGHNTVGDGLNSKPKIKKRQRKKKKDPAAKLRRMLKIK